MVGEGERWSDEPAVLREELVEQLAEVEALLHQAREARARLEAARAFDLLERADRLARASLEVPGASAWYAEVQLAIAVAAAEAGQTSLAEAALARASTIDPGRTLGAAEAPPPLVARAERVAREVASGPRGRFEVQASVPGARVALDGRELGEAPLLVEAPVGTHVLRVEAPGHRTWARTIDVFEGSRPEISIGLSPEPATEVARAMRAASEARDIDGVVAALAALRRMERAPRGLWLVEVSSGATDRALLVGCRPDGCSAPIRLDVGRVESALPEDLEALPGTLEAAALASARRWLDEPIATDIAPPPPRMRADAWLWALVGVAATGAVVGVLVATAPGPTSRAQYVVDGTHLPGW